MENPVLSVVMPVYNGEKYLKDSISSILGQTFNDFELIIINDGSRDKSLEVIKSFDDSRIRVINNERNFGIPYTRNVGLKEAKGEFLAWCDCDDISLPNRFMIQIDYLRKNKEVGACGTWLARFGGKKTHIFKAYKDSALIKATLLFKPSMPNATVMLRLDLVRQYNLHYNEELPIAEDYDFILQCSNHFQLANIEQVLYKYRASETSIMGQYNEQEAKSDSIHYTVYVNALRNLGIQPKKNDLITHRYIGSRKLFNHFSDLEKCHEWLKILKEQNSIKGHFDSKAFDKVLADQFLFICKKASRFGLRTFKFYLIRSYADFGLAGINKVFKLAIRCVIKYDKF